MKRSIFDKHSTDEKTALRWWLYATAIGLVIWVIWVAF